MLYQFNLLILAICFACKTPSRLKSVRDILFSSFVHFNNKKLASTNNVPGKTVPSPPRKTTNLQYLSAKDFQVSLKLVFNPVSSTKLLKAGSLASNFLNTLCSSFISSAKPSKKRPDKLRLKRFYKSCEVSSSHLQYSKGQEGRHTLNPFILVVLLG